MISQYSPDNLEMTPMIHDQGSTHMCWAYSTTTSIRNTWKKTLKQIDEAKKNGTWRGSEASQFSYSTELTELKSSSTFLEIRNLMLMSIIPKRIDIKDDKQSAYVRAAFVRVSYTVTSTV